MSKNFPKKKHRKIKYYIKKFIAILLWTMIAISAGCYAGMVNNVLGPHKAISVSNDDQYVMTFVGDSLTYGSRTKHTYIEFLSEELQPDVVYNLGLSRNEIAAFGDCPTPICTRYQSIDLASDFIMIWAGTNDWYHDIALGEIDDTINTTFYGALNQTMTGLSEQFPNSKIVFVTPLKRIRDGSSDMTNYNGNTLEEFANAIVACGAKYSQIEVIDLYHDKECDFTSDTEYAKYWVDGLHPKTAGHKIIARRLYDELFSVRM